MREQFARGFVARASCFRAELPHRFQVYRTALEASELMSLMTTLLFHLRYITRSLLIIIFIALSVELYGER